MTDADTMPTICAGTDTQTACRHFRAGGCWQPSNLVLDVVIGKLRPRNSAEWMRQDAPPAHMPQRCGIAAALFEPKTAPEAPAFLAGSKPWSDAPL